MYTAFDKFIFRTPVLPANDKQPFNLDDINVMLEREGYLDILYMSSTDLYNFINKTGSEKQNSKTNFALLRYYLRSKFRCTPFGLLAGIGIGNITDNPSAIQINPMDHYRRNTRLDMNYLCMLVQELGRKMYIKKYLKFFPNNSIHSNPFKIRYIEYTYHNGKRNHILTGVENNEFIVKILKKAEQGAFIDELAGAIDDDEISIDEKLEFITELTSAQLLVSELEPSVTGDDLELQIITVLKRLLGRCVSQDDRNQIEEVLKKIETIRSILAEVDQGGILNDNVNKYSAIEEIVKTINAPYESKYLFQADLVTNAKIANLHKSVTEDVMSGVDVIGKLSPQSLKTNLVKFKEAFYERWEDSEVSLNMALDTEQGIGYLQPSNENTDINPLIDDLALPSHPADSQTFEINSKLFQFWLSKYKEAIKNDHYEIALLPDDLKGFSGKTDNLANTFSVMLSVLGEGKEDSNTAKNKIFIKSVGGSTSANLLGRFCHGDAAIAEYTREMIVKDELFYEDKIVAEICHLPEARTGNILFRPVIRKYEIPYLTKSAVESEYQLPITDLMISVRNNRIYLRSIKFNKEVIPRLTSAHNFSYKSLPIYHLLSDLQTQDCLGGLELDLGLIISNSQFIPRVTFKKNIILQPAKWQFRKSDYSSLLGLKEAELQSAFENFKQKWKLPQFIALAEADNELVIDTTDLDSINLLVSEIKSKEFAVLVEFLFDPASAIIAKGNDIYTNEVIVSYYKDPVIKSGTGQTTADKAIISKPVKRVFIPGDEWLYFKIYTGYKTADEILSLVIQPFTEELLAQNKISKWFFIRYVDPKFHIRLRFLLKDKNNCGEIMGLLNERLHSYTDSGAIWNIQVDSYKRELERYGDRYIEQAESFFFRDSEAITSILGMIEGEEGEMIRWLTALRSVDEYLNFVGLNIEEKHKYIDELRGDFSVEFMADKDFGSQLDKKFRRNKSIIEHWLSYDPEIIKVNLAEYIPILDVLSGRSKKMQSDTEDMLSLFNKEQILPRLPSFLHMNINRIFRSKNRLHEYVVYDLLERHYRYQVGRKKALAKSNSVLSLGVNETI